ncbi:hypothetical protein L423_00873 [Enterobacter roggenkampii]|nr:hypothetical protein L423_00873 [Enterobacter roggenkampii]
MNMMISYQELVRTFPMGVWMIALILIASLIAGVVIYIDVISDFIIDANFLHLL